jgi:hypothetical protein
MGLDEAKKKGASWETIGDYVLELPDGAFCHVDGSCSSWISISRMSADLRRLRALDYIRVNYCMGLPEPPPPKLPAY